MSKWAFRRLDWLHFSFWDPHSAFRVPNTVFLEMYSTATRKQRAGARQTADKLAGHQARGRLWRRVFQCFYLAGNPAGEESCRLLIVPMSHVVVVTPALDSSGGTLLDAALCNQFFFFKVQPAHYPHICFLNQTHHFQITSDCVSQRQIHWTAS